MSGPAGLEAVDEECFPKMCIECKTLGYYIGPCCAGCAGVSDWEETQVDQESESRHG